MHEKWGVESSSFLRFRLPTALPEEGEETNSDTCAGNSEGKKREGKDRKTPESGDRKGNYEKRRHVCMAQELKVGKHRLHT